MFTLRSEFRSLDKQFNDEDHSDIDISDININVYD